MAAIMLLLGVLPISVIADIKQERLAIVQTLPAYVIGSVAMFWVIQRIVAL